MQAPAGTLPKKGLHSLPNKNITSIGLFAGREASASLCIALGKDTAKVEAAREALFAEPFTYWDWHEVLEHDATAKKNKRQRMREHRKGFRTETRGWQGYPTPRERWEMFKLSIEQKEARSSWVTRIAVAHWMYEEDLRW